MQLKNIFASNAQAARSTFFASNKAQARVQSQRRIKNIGEKLGEKDFGLVYANVQLSKETRPLLGGVNMFDLYADKVKLSVRRREPVTSGSVNVYQAQFAFSADWEGLTRTAVFRAGDETRSVVLDESGICGIPWEVLRASGFRLWAGVYGERGGEVVLPTVWAYCGTILEGAAPREEACPPAAELWEQELAKKGDTLGYTEEGKLGLYAGDTLLSSVAAGGGPPGEGGGPSGLAVDELNYEQYSALSEAEKAAGAYFVPDWPGQDPGEGAGEIYSTEERRIGTWIDGKPIYRKSWAPNITINASATEAGLIANVTDCSIDLLINGFGCGYYSGRNQIRALTANDTSIALFNNNTELRVYSTAATIIVKTITIEYTKTTD